VAQVYLRALAAGDLARTHRWHNDPALYATLVGAFRFVSPEAEQQWLAQQTGFSRERVSLAICLRPGGTHIGNLYIYDIDPIARRAQLGIFIGDRRHRGRGYGRAAMDLAIRHAFGDLGLQRLWFTVLADHAAAIRLYERCGFAVEGTLRRHAFKDGQFRDLLVMGLCHEARPARGRRPGSRA
jgi:RimJ/RimL family protein N-acetyltransferase